jgi:hypothetical protein
LSTGWAGLGGVATPENVTLDEVVTFTVAKPIYLQSQSGNLTDCLAIVSTGNVYDFNDTDVTSDFNVSLTDTVLSIWSE